MPVRRIAALLIVLAAGPASSEDAGTAKVTTLEWPGPVTESQANQDKPKPNPPKPPKPPKVEPRPPGREQPKPTGEPILKRRKPPQPPG